MLSSKSQTFASIRHYALQIGEEHPVATVNRLSKSLSVEEREMILGKTAARLLKL